jgi:hypothetical protein
VSLFISVYTHVINVAHRVTQPVNFDARSFVFLWNIVPKNHSSFVQHVDSKTFCWIIHFTKFVIQSVKNLYFPKVCHSLGHHGLQDRHYFQNGGIVGRGTIDRTPPQNGV